MTFTAAQEVMFSPLSICLRVGWIVNWVVLKVQDGFPFKLVEGWGISEGRTYSILRGMILQCVWYLVQIQNKNADLVNSGPWLKVCALLSAVCFVCLFVDRIAQKTNWLITMKFGKRMWSESGKKSFNFGLDPILGAVLEVFSHFI